MGDLLENLLEDVRLTRRLFQEDRVTEAYFLLQNIERFTQELHPELKTVIEAELEKADDIATLRKEGLRNANLLALFEDGDIWNDWTAGVGTNQDVVVGIHKEEVGGQYYFKVEGRIHCDLLNVLAAILENDLYKYWMPLCTSSTSIAAMSAYRRIVRTKVDFALIQKEALLVGHGDILPDGGVLVTMNPTTPQDEAQHLTPEQIAALPPAETRLDISGGFLFYEECEDAAGNSIHAAAAEYEAHNERLRNATQRGSSAKVLRRKTHSVYSKQFSFTGSPNANSFNRNLDLNAVATLSLANDKEYNDRMLTLGRKLATATKHSTEKQTQAAVTLDRYKLSVQELYDVKPHLGLIPNSSGLANTLNPMNVPSNAAPSAGSGKPSSAKSNKHSSSKSKRGKGEGGAAQAEKKLVLVKGIFRIDPRLTFMPDWIFNMAVRSASAMIIPMLEFQAQQFCPNGLHFLKLDAERNMYAEIQRRLAELHESNSMREENENAHYAGTSAFPNPMGENGMLGGDSGRGNGDLEGNSEESNYEEDEEEDEESSEGGPGEDIGGFAGKFQSSKRLAPLQIQSTRSFTNIYS